MTVWTTQPAHPHDETRASPHLFRDCGVLTRRDANFKEPTVYEHAVAHFQARVSAYDCYYYVEPKVGRFRYNVCRHCVRKAEREQPELLTTAEITRGK